MRQLLEDGAKAMGISLSKQQLDQFETYHRLLVEWNEKMNLTAITEAREVATKHFLDSIAGGPEILKIARSQRQSRGKVDDAALITLIDVGTGAGFPGLPLKIAFPEIELTLLDSLQKRVNFLQEVVDQLGLEGVTCLHGRAEDAAHEEDLREKFDVAVARAVAPMYVLMEYCGGYVKKGGQFVAYKGPSLEEELAEAGKAMKVMQLRHKKTLKADLPEGDFDHLMAFFEKTGNLSLKYPRKQAKIKKEKLA